MTCTSCHGTSPSQINPPVGVGGETTTNTLAVGRHVAHLTASNTHVAFACGTCHTVPTAGDVTHTAQYVASTSLSTAGHHGDVTFSAPATNMTWNVNATQGNPVTARGTCIGACHSNGRGGNPNVIPYWAGGNWNTGSCTSCHNNSMNSLSNRHPDHSGEATCLDCHPPPSSGTHMNGTWDVYGTITPSSGSGSVTTTGPGGPCNSNYSCTGTCHGKGHSNRCWN
jgi:predicted CxxxxCH...CXXCH cytochrome family protein